MTVNLSKLDTEFRAEAAAQYPNEACGYVVAKGKKQQFVPCVNSASADSATYEFQIDTDEYHRASAIGDIIAVWHSHPDKTNIPSEMDLVECENSELPWFITAVTKTDDEGFLFSETNVIEPTGMTMDYIGRPYHYGIIDCYSLVVDYYRQEFGIKLARLLENRKTRFWELDEPLPLMEEAYKKLGFEKLVDVEPEAGDLFLIQTCPDVANHVAIYLGGDMILHHCENRLSGRTVYGGYWAKHTIALLRHPDAKRSKEENGTNEGNS